MKKGKLILDLNEISIKDVPVVGGKNASLGEMYSKLTKKGIRIPNGFAITADAFRYYLKFNKIDEKLKEIFENFDPKSIQSLKETGEKARNLILRGKFPPDLEKEILENYQKLSKIYGQNNTDVAVRSSATAEDLASASFAGEHETYLNISGPKNLLKAIKKCLASLFTDRAIAYREEKGFEHLKIALSAGIQKMVRSDLASSGVMFTLDTESGFPNVVLINSIFGIGEMIVKGKITPDEFYVFKPTLRRFTPQGKPCRPIIVKNLGRKTKKYIYSKTGGLKEVDVSKKDRLKFSLTDDEVLTLAKWAMIIEDHYKIPQDIEWAKDGKTCQLFIVQSRPETVHAPKVGSVYEEYEIKTKKKPILTGIAIGNKIGQGKVHIIEDVSKIGEFQKGEVLVTKMTDPDWVPIMRISSAIVTNEGGKTCHAAIIGRELGIPAIVGTGKATQVLKTGQETTVDCTSGSIGKIFLGKVPFEIKRYDLKKMPQLKTKIMINIGAPDIAFKTSFLPNDGVGLARIEFILAEKIRIHPLALYHYKKLKAQSSKLPEGEQVPCGAGKTTTQNLKSVIREIEKLTFGYKDKKQYFVDKLAEGISQIAAAFYPKPVIVRLSDFKTNEYAALVGGKIFEPEESNPMLGWRGASRYYDEKFRPAFEMECKALKKAREVFGLKNIWAMVPFCRTVEEGKKVLDLMAKNGLEKGKDGLKVIVMCEIPSNVILAEEFLKIFDGMSIGSNDLAQLVLGLDRDSAIVAKVGDERNEAVKEMVKKVIKICNQKKKYCGICGQAPSDYVEFAKFIMKEGIQSMSINPDTVIKTILNLAKIKRSKK
jgi:pyruvate,water dikinase